MKTPFRFNRYLHVDVNTRSLIHAVAQHGFRYGEVVHYDEQTRMLTVAWGKRSDRVTTEPINSYTVVWGD